MFASTPKPCVCDIPKGCVQSSTDRSSCEATGRRRSLKAIFRFRAWPYRNNFEQFLALLTELFPCRAEPSTVGRLRLALHVEGNRNITITNQLADVEARVDVDVKGTLDDPSLTGHVEASGGTLLFQGNRYRVTRGTSTLWIRCASNLW